MLVAYDAIWVLMKAGGLIKYQEPVYEQVQIFGVGTIMGIAAFRNYLFVRTIGGITVRDFANGLSEREAYNGFNQPATTDPYINTIQIYGRFVYILTNFIEQYDFSDSIGGRILSVEVLDRMVTESVLIPTEPRRIKIKMATLLVAPEEISSIMLGDGVCSDIEVDTSFLEIECTTALSNGTDTELRINVPGVDIGPLPIQYRFPESDIVLSPVDLRGGSELLVTVRDAGDLVLGWSLTFDISRLGTFELCNHTLSSKVNRHLIRCITNPFLYRPLRVQVRFIAGTRFDPNRLSGLYIGSPTVTSYNKSISDLFRFRFRTTGTDRVFLWGTNFGYDCDRNICEIQVNIGNGVCTSPVIHNDSCVSCIQPLGTGVNVPVLVTVNGVSGPTMNIFNFSAPSVVSVVGPRGASVIGDAITITGRDFANVPSDVTVFFNVTKIGPGAVCSDTTFSGDNLVLESDSIVRVTIYQPLGDCSYSIYVKVLTQISSETDVTYRNRVPNRPPEGSEFSLTLDENDYRVITFQGSDIDEDLLDYRITQLPTSGALYLFAADQERSRGTRIQTASLPVALGNGRVVYEPNAYFNGVDSFRYQVIEVGQTPLSSPVYRVSITVNSVNQRPFTDLANRRVSTDEGVPKDISLSCSDFDMPALFKYRLTQIPTRGVLKFNGTTISASTNLTVFASSVTIRYEPPAYENGDFFTQLSWNCEDLNGASMIDDALIIVDVKPVNNPPSVSSKEYITEENTGDGMGLLIELDASDFDLNDPVTFYIAELPSDGSLHQVRADGSKDDVIGGVDIPVRNQNKVIYVPRQFFHGNSTFRFYAMDAARTRSSLGQVSVIVGFVNQAPEILVPSQSITIDDDSERWLPVNITVRDVDETEALAVLFNKPPARGFWSLDGGKTILNFPSSKPLKVVSDFSWFVLFMKQDDKGGGVPYSTLEFVITDSYNATSAKGTITAVVDCGILTFNNIWSASGRACEPCPVGGICSRTGSHVPVNQEGFYPASNSSLFLPCTPAQACPRGSIDRLSAGSQAFTAAFSCTSGYSGDRCGQCSSGYFRQGQSCEICTQNVSLGGMVALVLLILLGLMVLIYFLRKLDLGFITVLINYLQLLAIFQTFELGWSREIERLFHAVSFFNLSIEVASPECYIQDAGSAYETKWTIMMVLPLAFLAFSVCVIGSYFAAIRIIPQLRYSNRLTESPSKLDVLKSNTVKEEATLEQDHEKTEKPEDKKPEREQEQTKKAAETTPEFPAVIASIYVLFLKLIYLIVARRSLEIFDCTQQDDGKYYFDPEPSRVCYEAWWQKLLPGATLGIILYVVGIPALILYLFTERRRLLQLKQHSKFQEFILQVTYKKTPDYHEEALYWDVVILLRKFMVVVSGLFFTGIQAFQAVLLILVLQVAVMLQVHKKPYVIPTLNRIELMCLFSATIIITCGILFYVATFKSQVQAVALTAIVLSVVGLSISAVVLATMRHFVYLGLLQKSSKSE